MTEHAPSCVGKELADLEIEYLLRVPEGTKDAAAAAKDVLIKLREVTNLHSPTHC